MRYCTVRHFICFSFLDTNPRELDELEAVKEAMRRENSERRRKSSSDDSGRTSMPESPQKGRKGEDRERNEEERKPSGLINFSAARARQKTQIAAKAATSRGSELLGMIRLDIVTFDLLDMPPMPAIRCSFAARLAPSIRARCSEKALPRLRTRANERELRIWNARTASIRPILDNPLYLVGPVL